VQLQKHAFPPCCVITLHLYSGDSAGQCWLMILIRLAFTSAPLPCTDTSQSRPDSAHLYFSTGTRAPMTVSTCRAARPATLLQVNRWCVAGQSNYLHS